MMMAYDNNRRMAAPGFNPYNAPAGATPTFVPPTTSTPMTPTVMPQGPETPEIANTTGQPQPFDPRLISDDRGFFGQPMGRGFPMGMFTGGFPGFFGGFNPMQNPYMNNLATAFPMDTGAMDPNEGVMQSGGNQNPNQAPQPVQFNPQQQGFLRNLLFGGGMGGLGMLGGLFGGMY
jgi:hypothetical protein